nr:Hypothetical protein CBG08025 [Haemonchus contortus]
MSEDRSSHGIADNENVTEDMERDWIHQVEHEETIAPEAVHEEEVEEFIEVDGVVDDHDIGQNVLLHPNEVVISTGMREPGRQIYYADNSVEGTDELCMNLPDLLSRTIVFTNGSKMFLCFSKRCRKQLAFEGHLYNINGFVKPANWNLWRCANPSCKGAIRTSPNITELRVREPHCSSCHPDDVQIRLRITVYDLRLMAEFTDLPLDALYHAYLDKVMNEHTDIVHLFPSFETLRSNLEDHRANLVYRKRFAGEARETDSQAMYYDSFGVAAGNSAVKFRRTKPFPPTMCMSCHAIFGSTPEVPSQDQLLEHMFFDHNRKTAVISRFTFADPGLFEQWVRELQYHSRYRLKKLCLHDEHMYYLCQNDIRHYKNHNRTSVPDMHCTAFIRVLDWRLIIQGEINEVVVDYCLDHYYHSDDPTEAVPTCKPVDYFTPEVFMRELAARRERTQQLIQDKGLQRIKRRNQPPSFCVNPSLKMRKIDNIPRCHSPQGKYYDNRGEYDRVDGDEWVENAEGVFDNSRSQQRQKVVQKIANDSTAEKYQSREKECYVPSYITRRENFADGETYNSVLQFEMTCDMLKERMQYARSIHTVNHYLGKLMHILDDVMADPECAPSSSTADEVSEANISALQVEAPLSTDLPDRHCGSSPTTLSQVAVAGEKSFSAIPEVKSDSEESLPLRQKVLVRRGDNGQIVVVKRTILGKVRKVVPSVGTFEKEADNHPSMQQQHHPGSTQREQERECTSGGGPSRFIRPSREQEDGPPIGDLLRDVLYKNKVPRYDRDLLRGVRRTAYQTLSVQCNPSAEEEARRFIQKHSSKADESNVNRRPRGRPRKYP